MWKEDGQSSEQSSRIVIDLPNSGSNHLINTGDNPSERDLKSTESADDDDGGYLRTESHDRLSEVSMETSLLNRSRSIA